MIHFRNWWRFCKQPFVIGCVTAGESHPAYNISVITASSSARLSWLPAYDSGLQLHYTVWYDTYKTPTLSVCLSVVCSSHYFLSFCVRQASSDDGLLGILLTFLILWSARLAFVLNGGRLRKARRNVNEKAKAKRRRCWFGVGAKRGRVIK